ncbi:uncharacterized protein [Coffea arabica]|uniref:Tf2-1-like SH3-like domain-containing protein n=1 Tax=Coffea arabica TaxID=13443 RepID=A0A6P6V086_COFAR|nr:uncharacterized protein LOC113716024 [Coffea arabica]
MTPFQALYGYKPPKLSSKRDDTQVVVAEDWLRERVNWNPLWRENLLKAHNKMKQFADKHITDRSFTEGDWVYLTLQLYRQTIVALRKNLKLVAKYYGQYHVEKRIGSVAYKLKLPRGTAIHPIFHVSLLKPSAKGTPISSELPQISDEKFFTITPTTVLDRRVINRNGQQLEQVLIC